MRLAHLLKIDYATIIVTADLGVDPEAYLSDD